MTGHDLWLLKEPFLPSADKCLSNWRGKMLWVLHNQPGHCNSVVHMLRSNSPAYIQDTAHDCPAKRTDLWLQMRTCVNRLFPQDVILTRLIDRATRIFYLSIRQKSPFQEMVHPPSSQRPKLVPHLALHCHPTKRVTPLAHPWLLSSHPLAFVWSPRYTGWFRLGPKVWRCLPGPTKKNNVFDMRVRYTRHFTWVFGCFWYICGWRNWSSFFKSGPIGQISCQCDWPYHPKLP